MPVLSPEVKSVEDQLLDQLGWKNSAVLRIAVDTGIGRDALTLEHGPSAVITAGCGNDLVWQSDHPITTALGRLAQALNGQLLMATALVPAEDGPVDGVVVGSAGNPAVTLMRASQSLCFVLSARFSIGSAVSVAGLGAHPALLLTGEKLPIAGTPEMIEHFRDCGRPDAAFWECVVFSDTIQLSETTVALVAAASEHAPLFEAVATARRFGEQPYARL